jgi:hypothetical protein
MENAQQSRLMVVIIGDFGRRVCCAAITDPNKAANSTLFYPNAVREPRCSAALFLFDDQTVRVQD